MLLAMNVLPANTILLLQDSTTIIAQIWAYLTKQFTFGRITVSISGFITGAATILLTVLVARWTTTLLDRRIASRRHIDPGLRYTICRLAKYIIVAIGVLVTLKQAFGLDLTDRKSTRLNSSHRT